MIKLPKPTDENGAALPPSDVFDLCISRIRSADLKTRLEAIREQVARAASDYDSAATRARLCELKRQQTVGRVTRDEMMAIYTKRMVPKTQPGRSVYDSIIAAPKHGKCPLCGLGTVNTLDHHLPKSEYPILAVTPNNLVPSCPWCQTAKMEGFPTKPGEQTIHPYFDDFETEVWLRALVVEGSPAVFRFFAEAPAGWDTITAERLNSHLETFRLSDLYASNAGSELTGIRGRLKRLHQGGGPQAVREHLKEEASSREQESKNSWKAAMYRAAAASDWFCSGGFANE